MIYLDSSALVKLVRPEAESEALRAFLAARGQRLVASVLVAVEVRRAVRRDNIARLPLADVQLERVGMIDLTAAVIDNAGRLPDPSLRSLDAIHVATAMLLGAELDTMITYDKRMLAAAEANALPAVCPA